MERYENSATSSILTFLGGLAIGYGAALLFAPRSGRETRQMITDYAQTTGDKISTMARSALDSARQSADSATQKVGDYVDEARSKVKSTTSSTRGPSAHQ